MYKGTTMKLDTYGMDLGKMIARYTVEQPKQAMKNALEWEESEEERNIKKTGKTAIKQVAELER